MATGLSGCAKKALASLERPVLETLSTLCSTAKVSLQAVKIQKQALILALDVSLIPQQAKQALLNQLISTVQGAVDIVPTAVLALCPDLIQVNINVHNALSAPLQKALGASFEIKRSQSIKAETNNDISSIDSAIAFFDGLNSTIQDVLQDK